MELENRLPAVDPRPEDPVELLPPELFLAEFLDVDLAAERSENRLLDPLLAPRLDAAGRFPAGSEPSDDEVLLALFDEVTVMLEAL